MVRRHSGEDGEISSTVPGETETTNSNILKNYYFGHFICLLDS